MRAAPRRGRTPGRRACVRSRPAAPRAAPVRATSARWRGRRSVASRCHRCWRTGIGRVRRRDPEQADAAQDERHHRAAVVGAADQAAQRDVAADLRGAHERFERRAADVVERPGPARRQQRPRLRLVRERHGLARQDLRRAERPQPVVPIGLAGHREDAIAGAGEHVDGEAADAAGRAGDDNRAAVRRGAVAGERLDGERGGEAGGADGHRLERRQRVGDAHHPGRRHAREAGPAAPARRAELITGDEHARSRRPRRIGGVGDRAGRVDPRHVRVAGGDLVLAGRGEGVLVVERGVLDGDRDLSGRQRVEGELLRRAAGAGAGGAGHECAKRLSHGRGL